MVVALSQKDVVSEIVRAPGRKTTIPINGGFSERTREDQGMSVVIAVDNIHDAIKTVAASGGKVIGVQKPDNIPGVGPYAAVLDTEGSRVGLRQPAPYRTRCG